jgi:hypothetical protein
MRFASLAPALALALALAGCSSSPPPAGTTTPPSPTSPPAPEGPLYGVALSPKSFEGADFGAFFDEAREVGSLVTWGGPIAHVGQENGAPRAVAQLAKQKGLRVAIQTGLFQEGDAQPSWDNATLANLTRDAATFAAQHKPDFFALGVEVNRFFERDPVAFDQYARWYDGTYDAVKNASPATKVFVTFQYEWMEGKRGGLFGGDASAPDQWSLLDRFPKRDLTGFTTYPGLVLPDPDQAPADYYANLSRAGGPVAITEVAHFADAPAPGWASSPEEQARFVAWFGERMESVDPALVVWLHLHDQPGAPIPFRHMGLVGEAGERPAREAWRALQEP